MREITYLIYVVFYEALIWGGTGYAVFFLNHSGWWFALAIVASAGTYSPLKWMHGIETAQNKGEGK